MSKFTSVSELKNSSIAYQSIAAQPPSNGTIELGTSTIDNRGYWEEINFNKSTLQPYLRDNLESLKTKELDGIVYLPEMSKEEFYQYSVDALPYVVDPNDDDEIIRLDQYHDKDNHSKEHYLATEGKINYHIYPRKSGRTKFNGHIDNYIVRRTTNYFDLQASSAIPNENGYFLFKLNWGDGSPLEYTDTPKLLESSTLLEHSYKKPGFYSITGVVYVFKNDNINAYELFQTNILLNPSRNYEFNLYNYSNFATIGGISKDSSLVKSAVNMIGIDALDFNDERASDKVIEDMNLLDKLYLFNFLNKIDYGLTNPIFSDLLLPYSQEFSDIQYGSENFDFNFNISWQLSNDASSNGLNYKVYYSSDGFSPSENTPNNISEDYNVPFWYKSFFGQNDLFDSTGTLTSIDLRTEELAFDDIPLPQLFFEFTKDNEPLDGIIYLENNDIKFTLSPKVIFKDSTGEILSGWYALTQDESASEFNFQESGNLNLIFNFTESLGGDEVDPVILDNLNTADLDDDLDGWYLDENNNPDFENQYTGIYHKHASGIYHIGEQPLQDEHNIPTNEIIKIATKPIIKYKITIHNSDVSVELNTYYSKINFPGELSSEFPLQYNLDIGMPEGHPQVVGNNTPYVTIDTNATDDTILPSIISNRNPYPSLSLPHAPVGNQALMVDGVEITIRGNKLTDTNSRGEDIGEWEGWYLDSNYTELLTNENLYTLTLGDASTYGNITPAEDESGVLVINLYAKVKPAIEV